jgi:hypothetical protein
LAAAIGPISRFKNSGRLVAYFGLNPTVHQSGRGHSYHGRITKQGRSHARSMLVEAAWQADRSPSPRRAFFRRIATRRGKHVAAVAVARKLAVIVWHLLTKKEDYAGVRPALHAQKLRGLQLRAGHPSQRGRKGPTYAYNLARTRIEEKRRAEQAEVAYRRLTELWTKRGRRAHPCSSLPTRHCARPRCPVPEFWQIAAFHKCRTCVHRPARCPASPPFHHGGGLESASPDGASW